MFYFQMKEIVTIFILGLIILFGAIIINLLASFLGITTWYTLLNAVSEKGIIEFFKQGFVSSIYLYFIYPLILGLLGYYGYYFLN